MTNAPGAGDLRVWLEPGWDGGRVAAWVVDLPGAFASGADEPEALARAPVAAWAFADRMREHGETVDPGGDRPVVVEQVPARRLSDGSEVNALFDLETRRAEEAEVAAGLRRTRWIREDLLRLLERVGRFEEAQGALPGPAGSRTTREILQHAASAEAWFASRLDGSLRYEGPGEGDLDAYLEGTHRWAVAQVAALAARDPAVTRTDGKGERWTLPKVLRRMVYHAIDHLDELERRLDVAEGIVDRLAVQREAPPIDTLAELFFAANLRARAGDRDRLGPMVARSSEVVALYDGDRLVAFARALTDGTYNGYVSTVAVHPRWQGRGVGGRLMRELMNGRDEIKWVLHARPGVDRFYRGLGYEPAPGMLARRRAG